MQLPQFQSDDLTFNLMTNKWAGILNPIIASPLNQVQILKNVQLSTGNNTINHLLGHKLRGWFFIRQRGPAAVYDLQDDNSSPQLTLLLVSNANVSVDIGVF